MSVTRPVILLGSVAIAILVAVLLTLFRPTTSSERMLIRTRYESLRNALSLGDTNAARELFPPESRSNAHQSYPMLGRFAKALGWESSIRISGSTALVCPERNFLIPRWPPDGHTIEMVKIDGEWFFTGEVHID